MQYIRYKNKWAIIKVKCETEKHKSSNHLNIDFLHYKTLFLDLCSLIVLSRIFA